jgi:excisionase family DNA binding protein
MNAEKGNLTDQGFASVREAAAYLSVARSTVYLLMTSGELRYAKFGKSRRVPWRALKDYAERHLVGEAVAG